MSEATQVKVLTFEPKKCKGCMECIKACSMVHFKTENGGEQSALQIIKGKEGFEILVCDQRGLCLDMCPVGALSRRKNGIVWLDKKICIGCQACVGFCPIGAMRKASGQIEPFKCISCGACVRACPENALELIEQEIKGIKEIVYHDYKKE